MTKLQLLILHKTIIYIILLKFFVSFYFSEFFAKSHIFPDLSPYRPFQELNMKLNTSRFEQKNFYFHKKNLISWSRPAESQRPGCQAWPTHSAHVRRSQVVWKVLLESLWRPGLFSHLPPITPPVNLATKASILAFSTSFELASLHARVTSFKSTWQDGVSELVTRVVNDRTRDR